MSGTHVISPEFAWIAEAFRAPDDFLTVAGRIVARLTGGDEKDNISHLIGRNVSGAALLHATSIVDRFANREIILFADDATDTVVELNLWRQARATALHQHTFSAVTGVIAGGSTEILYEPETWTVGGDGIPDVTVVRPAAVVRHAPGSFYAVHAMRPGAAGTIHLVLHDHPLTVSVVCRTGHIAKRSNVEFSADSLHRVTGESPDDVGTPGLAAGIQARLRTTTAAKHSARDLLDLVDWAIACGCEAVFERPDLKVLRDLVAYVKTTLHPRKPALDTASAVAKFAGGIQAPATDALRHNIV